MNVSLFWDKLSKLILLLVVAAVGVFAFLRYLPLIRTNQNYRKELLALDGRVAEQERLARQLRASMESVQHDPKAVERLAREKLGWAKTNEMVIRFEPAVRR
jgi:cell division protein FtsB